MPMAVSPDRRFLYAATRSKPYSVFVYAIDPNTGALKTLSVSALAESFPYISLDKTGRYLFGASYGSHLISVNAVGGDGRVASEPLQVIPVGRNAHSIRVDESNRFVFVPTLGSDEIFQFTSDTERQISLHDGAHQQFPRYVRRRWCKRQAFLSGQYAHRETTTRLCD